MNLEKITEVQMQIIINESLYKKAYINEETYSIVNSKLLTYLKHLQLS